MSVKLLFFGVGRTFWHFKDDPETDMTQFHQMSQQTMTIIFDYIAHRILLVHVESSNFRKL